MPVGPSRRLVVLPRRAIRCLVERATRGYLLVAIRGNDELTGGDLTSQCIVTWRLHPPLQVAPIQAIPAAAGQHQEDRAVNCRHPGRVAFGDGAHYRNRRRRAAHRKHGRRRRRQDSPRAAVPLHRTKTQQVEAADEKNRSGEAEHIDQPCQPGCIARTNRRRTSGGDNELRPALPAMHGFIAVLATAIGAFLHGVGLIHPGLCRGARTIWKSAATKPALCSSINDGAA
jgi:hypothetical protein